MNTDAAKLYFDLFDKCSEQLTLDLPEEGDLEKLSFFMNRFLVNRQMSRALQGAGKPITTVVEDAASIAKNTKALDAYQKANRVGPYRNVAPVAPVAPDSAGLASEGMSLGRKLGLGALGAGGLGASYYAGSSAEAEAQKAKRGLAFGGGLATGLAAPHLLQGVNQIVANQGLMPGYSPYNFQSI